MPGEPEAIDVLRALADGHDPYLLWEAPHVRVALRWLFDKDLVTVSTRSPAITDAGRRVARQ